MSSDIRIKTKNRLGHVVWFYTKNIESIVQYPDYSTVTFISGRVLRLKSTAEELWDTMESLS